jgi:hypothetical protein
MSGKTRSLILGLALTLTPALNSAAWSEEAGTTTAAEATKPASCSDTLEHARKLAATIEREAENPGFSRKRFVEQSAELAQLIQTAGLAEDELVKGLTEKQRKDAQPVLDKIKTIRTALTAHLADLDKLAKDEEPNPDRIVPHANHVEKELKRWAKQCTKLGQQVGLAS